MGSTKADKVKKVTKSGKEDPAPLEDQVPLQMAVESTDEAKPDGMKQDQERGERAQKAQNALLQIEGKSNCHGL